MLRADDNLVQIALKQLRDHISIFVSLRNSPISKLREINRTISRFIFGKLES